MPLGLMVPKGLLHEMTLPGTGDGTRCEGVMAAGYPSAVTEATVQANIGAAEPGGEEQDKRECPYPVLSYALTRGHGSRACRVQRLRVRHTRSRPRSPPGRRRPRGHRGPARGGRGARDPAAERRARGKPQGTGANGQPV